LLIAILIEQGCYEYTQAFEEILSDAVVGRLTNNILQLVIHENG